MSNRSAAAAAATRSTVSMHAPAPTRPKKRATIERSRGTRSPGGGRRQKASLARKNSASSSSDGGPTTGAIKETFAAALSVYPAYIYDDSIRETRRNILVTTANARARVRGMYREKNPANSFALLARERAFASNEWLYKYGLSFRPRLSLSLSCNFHAGNVSFFSLSE